MLPSHALELLTNEGIVLTETDLYRLGQHVDLVKSWNRALSLVSEGDVDRLWINHVADSLSLARFVAEMAGKPVQLLDIGSGGGFPAVVLGILFPSVSLLMVERSERKAHFLRIVCDALELNNCETVLGEYPRAAEGFHPNIVTARAVEKPVKIHKMILQRLESGAVFLCQSAELKAEASEMFHVEQVSDDWTAVGLRRGQLWKITKQSNQAPPCSTWNIVAP